MTFPLNHWDNPRKTIASKYQRDDLAYGIHGGHMALQCLTALQIPMNELKDTTLADIGCGTGRVARVLAYSFKSVVGYDPNKSCIQHGLRECPGMELPNFTLTHQEEKIPVSDYSICVNVIEHLDAERAMHLLNLIRWKTRKAAVVYWHRDNNKTFERFFLEEGTLAFPESTGKIAVTVLGPEALKIIHIPPR